MGGLVPPSSGGYRGLVSSQLLRLAQTTQATDAQADGPGGRAQADRISCQKVQVPRHGVCIFYREWEQERGESEWDTISETPLSIPSQAQGSPKYSPRSKYGF